MTIFDNKYVVGKYPTSTGHKSATISINDISYPIIITAYSLSKQEKIQIIEAFSDSFHIYPFGKKADVLILAGYLLSDINKNKEHGNANENIIVPYENKLRAFASAKSGDLVKVNGPGDLTFTGIADTIRIDATADTPALMSFNMSLREVENILTAIPFSDNQNKTMSSSVGTSGSQMSGNMVG